MKKCLFLIATAVSLVACALKQEADVTDNRLTFVAKTESSADTRTVVEDETHVFWEPGDEIAVFSGERSGKFVTNLTFPSATASFTGTLGEDGWVQGQDLWALYPYSEKAVFDGETITTTLPSIQYARAGSFAKGANLAIAHSTNGDLQFYNVCGGVRFTLKEEGVKKVVFEGVNKEALSGKVKIGFDENGRPQVKEVTGESSSITLFPPEGSDCFQTGMWYYIVAIPGALWQGYQLRLYKESSYAKKTRAKRLTISRSIFGSIEKADDGIEFEATTTHFPKTKAEWNASIDLMSQLSREIHTIMTSLKMDSTDGHIDQSTFISRVLAIEGVADAFSLGSDERVVVVQKDGVYINTTINYSDDYERTRSSTGDMNLSVFNEARLLATDPDSESKRAVLFAPYYHASFEHWYYLYPIDVKYLNVKGSFEHVGYKTDVYLSEQASLDQFFPSNLSNYNIIAIATHGGRSDLYMSNGERATSLITGTPLSREWEYLDKLSFDSDIQKYLVFFLDYSGCRIGVTAPWFEAVEKVENKRASFPHTIVLAMACHSLESGDMANFFLSRGASAYCGINGTIGRRYMGLSVENFAIILASGAGVKTAVDLIPSQFTGTNTPLYGLYNEDPIYIVDKTPFNLRTSISSSQVTFEWDVNNSLGTFTYDLFVDDVLYGDLTKQKYVVSVDYPGHHEWYVETHLYIDGELVESFRSPKTEFYVPEVPEIVDLGLSVKWASCNLGAIFPERSTPAYAWGETETKTSFTWDTYKWAIKNANNPFEYKVIKYCTSNSYGERDGKTVLDPGDDAAHVLLGGRWRMPTRDDLKELIDNCTISSFTYGGIQGVLFRSNIEGYTDRWIFIPGTRVGLWSSSLASDNLKAYYLRTESISGTPGVRISTDDRCQGMTIRPVYE